MMERTTNSHVWAGVLVKTLLDSNPQSFPKSNPLWLSNTFHSSHPKSNCTIRQQFDFATIPWWEKMIGFGPVKFGPMFPQRLPTLDGQLDSHRLSKLLSSLYSLRLLPTVPLIFFFFFGEPTLNVLFVLPEASSVEVFLADFIHECQRH